MDTYTISISGITGPILEVSAVSNGKYPATHTHTLYTVPAVEMTKVEKGPGLVVAGRDAK